MVTIKFPKIVLCLLFFAIVLFLVNIFLMLKYNTQRREFQHDFKINQGSYSSIDQLPTDSSGLYYIHINFIKSKRNVDAKDLVLVSHCTGNHLHHLITLSQTWNGPISIAIFVPGYTLDPILSALHILYRCFQTIHRGVSVHLVYPRSDLPQNDELNAHLQKAEEMSSSVECVNALPHIQNRLFSYLKNYAAKIEYPNNLLRNVARRSMNAKFSLVVDIDMVPDKGLYKDFIIFAEENKLFNGGNSFYDDKSVFVLPAFETNLESSESLPKNKKKLLDLVNIGKVRPFYYDICWKCRKPTDYERWESLGNGDSKMNVGYEVKWKDPWEPFFITSSSGVDYDERFRQYGFNRISQACELHVAGFTFFVLDGAFLLHQGFKNIGSFHKSKDDENERNKILFRTFKTELKTKYPYSKKRC